MKLSVVIPVYNERRYIEAILKKVQAIDLEKEVIIVDDFSTDGTREFLEELMKAKYTSKRATFFFPHIKEEIRIDNIKVIFQKKNMGKGAALREGFKEAKGEVIVIQDADLEYDPKDYYKLLEPIESGLADVVYGSRFLERSLCTMPFWNYIVNRFLTALSNFFTNLHLTDMETCYKVFRKEIIDRIQIEQDRFGFEPEITAKIARLGSRIYEVPISYYGRSYKEGKKIGWKDGLKAIWCIIRYNLYRLF